MRCCALALLPSIGKREEILAVLDQLKFPHVHQPAAAEEADGDDSGFNTPGSQTHVPQASDPD